MFSIREVLSQTSNADTYMQMTSQLLVRLTDMLSYCWAPVPFHILERASVCHRPFKYLLEVGLLS